MLVGEKYNAAPLFRSAPLPPAVPTIRAKFKVDEIRRHMGTRPTGQKNERGVMQYESCELRTVLMSPVWSDDPNSENHRFWEASPSGKIELGCANLEAAAMFELGKEYYVDFTSAE